MWQAPDEMSGTMQYRYNLRKVQQRDCCHCFHNSKFRIILFRTPLATWIIFFDLLIFAVGIIPDIFSDFIESCHSPLDYVKGINTTGTAGVYSFTHSVIHLAPSPVTTLMLDSCSGVSCL